MSYFEIQSMIVLGIANVALYLLLTLQLVRKGEPGGEGKVSGPFEMFEEVIAHRPESLPPGYTWREAVEWAKSIGVPADWDKVEGDVARYEGLRYGGKPPEVQKYEGMANLVQAVRREKSV